MSSSRSGCGIACCARSVEISRDWAVAGWSLSVTLGDGADRRWAGDGQRRRWQDCRDGWRVWPRWRVAARLAHRLWAPLWEVGLEVGELRDALPHVLGRGAEQPAGRDGARESHLVRGEQATRWRRAGAAGGGREGGRREAARAKGVPRRKILKSSSISESPGRSGWPVTISGMMVPTDLQDGSERVRAESLRAAARQPRALRARCRRGTSTAWRRAGSPARGTRASPPRACTCAAAR